jgi:Ca2+-binding RTX toxin-like protein
MGTGSNVVTVGRSGAATVTGGSGTDNITGSDQADSISSGSGADTILGGGGNDTLDGGSGNDSINAGIGADAIATSSGIDTIDGGDGTDILTITAAFNNISTSTISNVETLTSSVATTLSIAQHNAFTTISNVALTLSDAGTITTNSGVAAYVLANGTNTIAPSTATEVANKFTGGTGVDTFNFGQLAATPTTHLFTAADTIAAGTGIDTLNILGNQTFDVTLTTTEIVGDLENITFANTTKDVTLTTVTENLADATSMTIDASALTTGKAKITVVETGTGSYNIITGAAADTIVGSAAVDTITSGAGNDSITGNGGADVIDAGNGDDTLVYVSTASLFTGKVLVDSITGGVGIDTILIGSASTAFGIASDDVWTRSNTVEKILSVVNTAATDVVLHVSAETAGITTVDISLASHATDNSVDVSSFLTNGVTITTGVGATLVKGGAGADTITGGAGVDTITGGAGADAITAAGGSDVVILAGADSGAVTSTKLAAPGTFSATEVFTHGAVDKITGFTTGDKIQLYTTGTTAITTIAAPIVAGGVNPAADKGLVAAIVGTQTNATTFTAATGGADTLFIWDIDGTGANAVYAAVILVGYVAVADDTVSTAGLYTAAA